MWCLSSSLKKDVKSGTTICTVWAADFETLAGQQAFFFFSSSFYWAA
jgi:hypothetical protein